MAEWLPGADLSQRFDSAYPGARMGRVDKGVIHTTETPSWPAYGGGKSAPTATALWDGQRLQVRQHFPLSMAARALRNAAGGVQTNTAGVFQVELVGTCDRTYFERWRRQYPHLVFWPEAPSAALEALAQFMRTVEAHTAIPRSATSRPWLAYGADSRAPGRVPASYGASPARMSHGEWSAFAGWCGHQHVPENDHGDPGALPVHALMSEGGADFMSALSDEQQIQLYEAIIGHNGPGRNNFHWLADQLTEPVTATRDAVYGNNPEGENNFHWLARQVGQVDVDALAARIVEPLADRVKENLAGRPADSLSKSDVHEAVRAALADLTLTAKKETD